MPQTRILGLVVDEAQRYGGPPHLYGAIS